MRFEKRWSNGKMVAEAIDLDIGEVSALLKEKIKKEGYLQEVKKFAKSTGVHVNDIIDVVLTVMSGGPNANAQTFHRMLPPELQ